MESAGYDRFTSSDTENIHHSPKVVLLKGGQNKLAYILYGLLLLLLLILMMITGIKFSQLSQGIEDVKIYLTTVRSSATTKTHHHEEFTDYYSTYDPSEDIVSIHQGNCDEGWYSFDERCYYVSDDIANWERALQLCKESKALLFVPNNLQEMEFITHAADEEHMYWIGLEEHGVEGNWTLVDGTDYKSMPKYWDVGQPDDWHIRLNGEDCGQLHPTIKQGLRRWNDAECTLSYRYICEKA
ncbi:hepatic lectin-like [Engraulis encrasicolus]|uniref:hepatic lectin-like n=1 Tax=Engraulis encrasicolus TaxID=184585 RepID=UPI002FD2FF19